MFAGKHDIHQDAQGIDIRSWVRLRQPKLFRRGVASGSHNTGIIGLVRFINSGSIKIKQFHHSVIADHNIFRFDVPMDNPVMMEAKKRIAER